MLIAREKYQTNIVEYILYMFHIEDLILIRRNGPEIVSRAGQWQTLFVSA